jgi:hypothetical protein
MSTVSGHSVNGHLPVWHMDVAHQHSGGKKRVDTRITLWRPINGSTDWVIEKRLDDLGGSTLAALAVRNEKQTIRTLMDRGLPCAPLVEWQPGNEEVLAVFTRYAGASVEEAMRHSLPPFDYAALTAATLEAADQYARANVLVYDFSARNAAVALTGIVEGHLLPDQVVMLDHAHTVCAGGAEHRPFPYIGIQPAACPELAALLLQDVRRPIRQQVPDCPVDTLDELRALPPEQRSFWMSRLKSPAAGGALDRGELNIAAILQSLFAYSLLELLRRHQDSNHPPLPSQRLHPNAVAFLLANQQVLQRMNHPDPQQRFASLGEAAAAWRAGAGTRPANRTALKLVPPSGGPIEGASQPETAPPDLETASVEPTAWSRWTAATPTPDSVRTEARSKLSWSALSANWRAQSDLRRAAALLACTVLLAVPAATGWVRLPTPQSLAAMQSRTELDALARALAGPAGQRSLALQQLTRFASEGTDPAARQRAAQILKAEWRRLAGLLASDLWGQPLQPTEVRERALAEVQRLAALGVPEAKALVR